MLKFDPWHFVAANSPQLWQLFFSVKASKNSLLLWAYLLGRDAVPNWDRLDFLDQQVLFVIAADLVPFESLRWFRSSAKGWSSFWRMISVRLCIVMYCLQRYVARGPYPALRFMKIHYPWLALVGRDLQLCSYECHRMAFCFLWFLAASDAQQ